MNWPIVRDAIKDEIEPIFQRGTPQITNLDEILSLFRKVIYHLTRDKDLNGLSHILPNALQEALVDKVGQIGPLRILAESIEAYFKKLYVIAGLGNEQNAKDRSLSLVPLMKALKLNTALTNQTSQNPYPQLDETSLPGYSGAIEYLEQICRTYITRNKVHLAPRWSKAEVLQRLADTLAVYIYSTSIFENQIRALPVGQPETNAAESIKPEEKYLYYFISYGDTTNKIKNQIVNAYILQFLQRNGKVTVDQLRTEVNQFFQADMDPAYYMSIIIPLKDAGSVHYDKEDKTIVLSTLELNRIEAMQSNFDEDKKLFFWYLEDICKKFGLNGKITEIFEHLRSFLEANYQIDIAEGSQKGKGIPVDERECYKSFAKYLTELSGSEESARGLYKEMIELSLASDFLLKMCASSVFARISNPERFEQYIREYERVVYLDTQIILFALCLDYGDEIDYDNFFFKTVGDLFQLFSKDPDITVRVSFNYLKEAAHQLKLALMLIPFEEMGGESLSGNVFYRFYYYLKSSNKLRPEDRSYAEFMLNFLHLKEADAYKHNYLDIATRAIEGILYDLSDRLKIVDLPPYHREAFNTIDDLLRTEGVKKKSKYIMDNDAKMLTFLCDPNEHDIEPFFLTWDKHWVGYRKNYIETYVRTEVLSFHLFNPAKFINHNSLIRLKINPQAITNDLLSLMESYHSYVDTQTIWDQINKFTNIENISPDKRRRYMSTMISIFKDEFEFTRDDIETRQKMDRMANDLDDIATQINDYFYSHSQFKLDDYRATLLDEKYFGKIIRIVVDSAANTQDPNFLDSIDGLVKEFKEGFPEHNKI